MKILFIKSLWESVFTTKTWNDEGLTVQHTMFFGDKITVFFNFNMLADLFT